MSLARTFLYFGKLVPEIGQFIAVRYASLLFAVLLNIKIPGATLMVA
jgi:hypothetical protein